MRYASEENSAPSPASRTGAFIALAVVLVGITSFLAFSPAREGTTAFWLLAIGPQALLALIGAYFAHKEGLLREWFTPKWGDASLAAAQTFITMAGAWAGTKLLFAQGTPRQGFLLRLYIHLGDPRDFLKHIPLVAATLLIAAAAEETLWRGVVPMLLEPKVGSRRAWIYGAFLYALAHVPTAFALRDANLGPNPVLPLAALACGLVWAFAVRKTGRLVPTILAHALFAWFVIVGYRLAGPSF